MMKEVDTQLVNSEQQSDSTILCKTTSMQEIAIVKKSKVCSNKDLATIMDVSPLEKYKRRRSQLSPNRLVSRIEKLT